MSPIDFIVVKQRKPRHWEVVTRSNGAQRLLPMCFEVERRTWHENGQDLFKTDVMARFVSLQEAQELVNALRLGVVPEELPRRVVSHS